MRRHLTWLSLVLLAMALALNARAGGAAAQSAPTGPAATEIKLFVPWQPDATINSSLQVSSRDSFPDLTCQSQAISTTRPDAWRCGTDDPCFVPYPATPEGAPVTLACANRGPWSGTVQLLTVNSPLRSSDACQSPPRCREQLDLSTNPWAIELANGVRCTLVTGTIGSYAGVGMAYGCANQDGTPAGVAGSPTMGLDRSQPVWQVFYQAPGDYVLQQTPVLVAWY